MTLIIDIIIPTRLTPDDLSPLVQQIEATAGYPHRILFTGSRGSAAFNRNLGLSQVRGDRVVMVDDDIEFPGTSLGWLRVLSEALTRPEVIMVSAQLLNPDGSFAYMTGLDDCGLKPRTIGETIVPSRRLLTACCAFKHRNLRFDQKFIGSGFEDIDFCNQLALARPDSIFLVCHSAIAIHRNEAKNQRGPYWEHNERYYISKWGKITHGYEPKSPVSRG